jgi:hypothetical protein
VPDTEPGKRITDAGARTDGRKALPSLSEMGAGYGKAACPVLCEGTGVTRSPTANGRQPCFVPKFKTFGKFACLLSIKRLGLP